MRSLLVRTGFLADFYAITFEKCYNKTVQTLGRASIERLPQAEAQGQFAGEAFTGVLKSHEIKLSMDGKGRALENVMIDRLWRIVK